MAEQNILLVSNQILVLEQLKTLLKRTSFRIIDTNDGYSALRLARSQCPVLAIIDQDVAGIDCFQLGEIFEVDDLAPIVYVLDNGRKLQYGTNYPLNVFGFIERPIQPNQFKNTLEHVILSISKMRQMKKKIDWLERKCLSQKIVGQAKYYLMQDRNWNEEQAYDYIKRHSMNRCINLEKTAKQILEEKRCLDQLNGER